MLAVINFLNFIAPIPIGIFFSYFLLKYLQFINLWIKIFTGVILSLFTAVYFFIFVLSLKGILYFPQTYTSQLSDFHIMLTVLVPFPIGILLSSRLVHRLNTHSELKRLLLFWSMLLIVTLLSFILLVSSLSKIHMLRW